MIIAEDRDGANHLVAATEGGQTYRVASAGGSEFTGPVFSADGSLLFANVQKPGTLYAITGPWRG